MKAGKFLFSEQTRVFSHALFRASTEILLSPLRKASGLSLPLTVLSQEGVEHGGTEFTELHLEHGHVCLVLSARLKGEEYEIDVDTFGVRLAAGTVQGMAHALHTLLQLLPPAVFSPGPRIGVVWAAPCLLISDQPQHPWRGAMLDCVRHFIPISELKRFIDLFALHHLNVLQLHLNDDQGWRIEIQSRPELTNAVAWRPGTTRGHQRARAGVEAVPHGGFYTQAEMKELITYAEVRGVSLVPEIDFPGHATAALAAYPQLASGPAPSHPACDFGILESAIFPSEENLEFITPIYEELMELFPSPYFHIGGDELKLDRWRSDSRIPELLREYRLESLRELQPWFTRRLQAVASKHGKRIIGWEEIYHPKLPEDAVIMSWRGEIPADREGTHEVIMAPYTHLYFDYYQSVDIEKEPLAIEGVTTLEHVYSYDPLSGSASSGNIIGLQGQLWTEYLPTEHARQYMAFPRFCALSEVGWGKTTFEDFCGRLKAGLSRFDVRGTTYRPLRTQDSTL